VAGRVGADRRHTAAHRGQPSRRHLHLHGRGHGLAAGVASIHAAHPEVGTEPHARHLGTVVAGHGGEVAAHRAHVRAEAKGFGVKRRGEEVHDGAALLL